MKSNITAVLAHAVINDAICLIAIGIFSKVAYHSADEAMEDIMMQNNKA